jgi:hypothetical protein
MIRRVRPSSTQQPTGRPLAIEVDEAISHADFP